MLGNLNDQRGALKSVQKKVLSVANSLGVSNSVIKTIESRQFWDKVILYGGMLFTLLLLWYVFF